MIAIISSHVMPRNSEKVQERISDTFETINSLKKIGINSIYLADNSSKGWDIDFFNDLKDIKTFYFSHPYFANYGISELYLLLEMLNYLPDNEKIIKISGRYKTDIDISTDLEKFDIIAKMGVRSISTRYYAVNNKNTFRILLYELLNQIYGYQNRIVGPRSCLRIIKNSVFPHSDRQSYFDPSLGIEQAFYFVRKKFKIKYISNLGISGYIKGDRTNFIQE